ncbi:MAG: spore maturation protein [Clostridia bacterium]
MMCFWSGIFNIFEKTATIKKFSKCFSRLLYKIFNKEKLSDLAMNYISMNVATNILGVGNAATLNGIKAMEEMQKENTKKDIPSNNMTTFVLINTASLQLIPTSMIALRVMYSSVSPTAIVVPIWIVTFSALIVGITSIKTFNKKWG